MAPHKADALFMLGDTPLLAGASELFRLQSGAGSLGGPAELQRLQSGAGSLAGAAELQRLQSVASSRAGGAGGARVSFRRASIIPYAARNRACMGYVSLPVVACKVSCHRFHKSSHFLLGYRDHLKS